MAEARRRPDGSIAVEMEAPEAELLHVILGNIGGMPGGLRALSESVYQALSGVLGESLDIARELRRQGHRIDGGILLDSPVEMVGECLSYQANINYLANDYPELGAEA